MTNKIEQLLFQLKQRGYRQKRTVVREEDTAKMFLENDHMWNFRKLMEIEQPILYEHDDFGFHRSTEWILKSESGNLAPNYFRIISQGFDSVKMQIEQSIVSASETKKKAYGKTMLDCIEICYKACENYRTYAKEKHCTRLYQALCKIPYKGAETFYEACVFLNMCIYFLRCAGAVHLGIGRFDQYMYSFYLQDKQNGVSDEEIFQDLEALFISLNMDTDLYVGIQQGDNGQSLVLGGFDKDGNSMYNELSEMCLKASLELCVIDPKINLRVGRNTPDYIYEFATELTKKGLGFPQYCNDDVVVPGLRKLGYSYEDALDYVVAACWEYIIPGCGGDIPNIAGLNFPAVIHRTICKYLTSCESFRQLMNLVNEEITEECEKIIETARAFKRLCIPFLSIFMDGCIENLTDVWEGGTKYKNFGCHGIGIANGADALSAIKKHIFEEKTITSMELLEAMEKNFCGYEKLRNSLKNSPKMGNNDDYVDEIATEIMGVFASCLNNRDNGRGGIWRAGTGSAMEYMIQGEKCPATADGRKSGTPFPANFSPSLDVKISGLLSIIQSFTKYDLSNIINGGPLTLEIHDSVLQNEIGIKKTAMLVKNFILLGGHQLQLNSINREVLLDAQKHPEIYPNLIVRVWGWSGYFNELDKKYQNHIICRTEYMNI